MFELEFTIGNRTYHYGSLSAFREHKGILSNRVQHLSVAVYRDGIEAERKAELAALMEETQAIRSALDEAEAEENRKFYAAQATA